VRRRFDGDGLLRREGEGGDGASDRLEPRAGALFVEGTEDVAALAAALDRLGPAE
jgi:hypothetical protein